MDIGFKVTSQYPGYDTVGGVQTQPVTFVDGYTLPSQIALTYPVAQSAYSADVVKAAGLSWADIAETLNAQPNVVGVQWTQVVNDAQQLVTAWIVAVASNSGNSVGSLTIPNNSLGPEVGRAEIDALNQALTDAES
jgi:hypothetical protein